MSGKTMDERVTTLEKLAETLAPLPGEVAGLTVRMGAVESRLTAVELQQLQLRAEMHAEFLAVRQEMARREDIAAVRGEIAAQGRELAGHFVNLRTELGTQMRVLYEDLVERIARINRG